MSGGSWLRAIVVVLAIVPVDVAAHSASDAYLTFAVDQVEGRPVVHAQWDIALRDLDFVIGLDADGDGRITWRELRARQTAIARYAQARLSFGGDGRPCRVVRTRQQVAEHADGSYAALLFDIDCGSRPSRLTVDYRLFFDVDPSHRAIVVSRAGGDTATAVLSPAKRRIDLDLGGR